MAMAGLPIDFYAFVRVCG